MLVGATSYCADILLIVSEHASKDMLWVWVSIAHATPGKSEMAIASNARVIACPLWLGRFRTFFNAIGSFMLAPRSPHGCDYGIEGQAHLG